MMYSPSPQTQTNRPLQLCLTDCGKISHAPRSLGTSGSRSPSAQSASPSGDSTTPLQFAVWISLFRAYTSLPVCGSNDATGTSLPSVIMIVPSS